MPIYTYRGSTIEVAKGGRSARASRVEVRDTAGVVIQSAASAEFGVLPDVDAPTPQVQAERWAKALAQVFPADPIEEPTEIEDVTDGQ